MKMSTVAVAFFCMTPMPALSDGYFYNGNTLYELCKSEKLAASLYVIGVRDQELLSANTFEKKSIACYPEGVTVRQLADVACGYLERYPERRHYNAPSIVMSALSIAFPCK